MKYLYILTLISLLSSSAFAQGKRDRNADIGVFAGTTYYLGDLNPIIMFSSPRYAVGPILRYNFNRRYSLKTHAIYSNIAGSDLENNQFITKRNYPVSFSTNLVNLGGHIEFNFFYFESASNPGQWTPYVFGGAAYSVILTSNHSGTGMRAENHMTIPFGIGAKLNVTRKITAGIEWSHHKTFTSRIDGVVSPVGETFLTNNDWYSYFGLFITYKFFKFAADCPAYD